MMTNTTYSSNIFEFPVEVVHIVDALAGVAWRLRRRNEWFKSRLYPTRQSQGCVHVHDARRKPLSMGARLGQVWYRCHSEWHLITAPPLPGLGTIIQLRDQIRCLSSVSLVAESACHQTTNLSASVHVSRKSGFLDSKCFIRTNQWTGCSWWCGEEGEGEDKEGKQEYIECASPRSHWSCLESQTSLKIGVFCT